MFSVDSGIGVFRLEVRTVSFRVVCGLICSGFFSRMIFVVVSMEKWFFVEFVRE